MYCVSFAAHHCSWVPIHVEGIWSLLCRSSLLPVFWLSTRAHIVVEGECIKLCSVKLDNIHVVPMVHGKTIHAVQQIVSDFCSCCMFLGGENCVSWRWKAFTTSSIIERKKSLRKLSPQCIVPKSIAETGKQSFNFAHCRLWVNCVLHNNWQYCNLIGPYHISVIGPRNSTWFTRPFSLWEVWSGHETRQSGGCATLYQPMTVFAVTASSYPVNFGGSTDSIDRYTV